jgi:hypothetical protein
MPSGNLPTLTLEARPRQVLTISLAVLMSAVLVVVTLMLAGKIRGGVAVACLLAGGATVLAVFAWRRRAVVHQVTWMSDGTCHLTLDEGSELTGRLLPDSWITPWCWCLRFRGDNQLKYVVLVWHGWMTDTAWQRWQTRFALGATQESGGQRPVSTT